jgi:hypothetical protein
MRQQCFEFRDAALALGGTLKDAIERIHNRCLSNR